MDSCDPPTLLLIFKKRKVVVLRPECRSCCVSVKTLCSCPPIFFSMFTAVCIFWLFSLLSILNWEWFDNKNEKRTIWACCFLGCRQKDEMGVLARVVRSYISKISDTIGFDCRHCFIRRDGLNSSLSVSLRFQIIEFQGFSHFHWLLWAFSFFSSSLILHDCTWDV